VTNPVIRQMTETDLTRVIEIFGQGIKDGNCTFTSEVPSEGDFDGSHLPFCRFVAESDGCVAGWIAISAVSRKPAYSGSVEVSLYVDRNFRGRGIGKALLLRLIECAPDFGVWSLLSVIFQVNSYSILLHERLGFRTIGFRERIAKDIFGNWQNTVLMELRLPDEGA